MKKELLVESVCVAACRMVGTASADVVGWGRFNGEGANVPNVAETADGLPDGTGVAGAYIYGTIDQLRMSAGILDPSEFMRYDSTRGTVLTVR